MATHAHRRTSALEPSPLALVGGLLALVSGFLAWDDMAGAAYDDAFAVPLQFLWELEETGGFTLGLPLVLVGAVVALFSVSPLAPVVFLRRLGGVALLGAVALFVVQVGRRFGWDELDVGAGAWLAGAGGLLALLAPAGLWPLTRRRSEPERERSGAGALELRTLAEGARSGAEALRDGRRVGRLVGDARRLVRAGRARPGGPPRGLDGVRRRRHRVHRSA